jgi:putative FmdB family regulatory protein
MPTYVYRCEKDKRHTFEVVQSIKDEPVKTCPKCQSPVARVIFPPLVMVKRDILERTDRGEFNPKGEADDDWGLR